MTNDRFRNEIFQQIRSSVIWNDIQKWKKKYKSTLICLFIIFMIAVWSAEIARPSIRVRAERIGFSISNANQKNQSQPQIDSHLRPRWRKSHSILCVLCVFCSAHSCFEMDAADAKRRGNCLKNIWQRALCVATVIMTGISDVKWPHFETFLIFKMVIITLLLSKHFYQISEWRKKGGDDLMGRLICRHMGLRLESINSSLA